MAGKTLTQPVTSNQYAVANTNQQAEYDAMVQQSMVALEQQELLEQEAYLTGNMSGIYDSYSNGNGVDTVQDNVSLSDVDSTITEQQESQTGNKQFTHVFAKLFGTLANVFGKDSQIGSKLNDIAEQLENTYGQDAYEVQQDALDTLNEKTEKDVVSDTSVEEAEEYIPTAEEQKQRQAQLDASNSNMQKTAELAVADDDFLEMAEDTKDKDFTHMTAGLRTMELRLGEQAMGTLCAVDAGAKEKSEVANSYMTMMRGIKVYNDKALTEIETKYQDDPEKLETAKQGLSNLMSRAGTQAYDIIGDANRQYDFLSEQDKLELDSLNLHGVNQTYSEYVKANQKEPQQQEDMTLYAGADNADVTDTVWISKESTVMKNDVQSGMTAGLRQMSAGVESRTAMQNSAVPTVRSQKNRGAMAEAAFASVLQKEEQANQVSWMAGLER